MEQDRDDDTDDDDNLILDGAAEQELKQKSPSDEKPANTAELEEIKSKLQSTASSINVNKDKKNEWDI